MMQASRNLWLVSLYRNLVKYSQFKYCQWLWSTHVSYNKHTDCVEITFVTAYEYKTISEWCHYRKSQLWDQHLILWKKIDPLTLQRTIESHYFAPDGNNVILWSSQYYYASKVAINHTPKWQLLKCKHTWTVLDVDFAWSDVTCHTSSTKCHPHVSVMHY